MRTYILFVLLHVTLTLFTISGIESVLEWSCTWTSKQAHHYTTEEVVCYKMSGLQSVLM